MTIEISAKAHLLWPTLQHQQGNFELLIKQQLESGSHHLTQQKVHSQPEDPAASEVVLPEVERSTSSIGLSDQPHARNSGPIADGIPRGSALPPAQIAGGIQATPKMAIKPMNAAGISARFTNMPSTPDIKRSPLIPPTAATNQTDVTSTFKPANVLIIRSEQEVRLYIRDFFADEHELTRWAGSYIVEDGADGTAPTHIYINGKPFRINDSNLVQEEDRHGN